MSRTSRRTRAAFGMGTVGVLLAAVAAAPVHAQDQGRRPVLGGHRFVWNPLTETPFAQTHVRNLTGGGKFTGVEFVPEIDLGDGRVLAPIRGDLLFAELEFEYMHRVQPWLGVWARLGGIARVGTDTGALLAQGVTAIFGYDIGWLFRLYHNDRFILSGIAAVSDDGVTDVNLLRWVRGVIAETGDPLVSAGPRLRGRTGLRAGWGINESWGMQFKSELGYGESTVLGSDLEWLWDHAVSLSYDLYPAKDIPLGFTLSGASRSSPREGGRPGVRSRDFALRTAFTASGSYLIALDTSWNGLDLADGDSVGLVRAGLALQLFF
jgi:hypothetical protein